NLEAPLFIDMATSAAAAGKLKVAAARGVPVPEGWLVDAEGRRSTDPRALGAGGVLLPLGGTEGYKGYGLSAIVEILSGLLTGVGSGVVPTVGDREGCVMEVFNVVALRPLETLRHKVTEFAQYLNDTPRDDIAVVVLYPGEIDYRRSSDRSVRGIDVE